MDYVVHHRFKSRALCGNVNIPYGTVVEDRNGVLCHGDKPLCVARSQNGKEHFARNDDGNGLERGKITHWIAFEALRTGAKHAEERRKLVCKEYERFLRPECDGIIFTDEFFHADIAELRDMQKKILSTIQS